MFGEKDLSTDLPCDGENSVTYKLKNPYPAEKMNLSQKGLDFLRESAMNLDGFPSKPSKPTNSGSQELTLRYLCENPKLGCSFPEKMLTEKLTSQKGKEVLPVENSNQDEKWVERDFMNLSESRVNSSCSKREIEEEEDEFQGENNSNNREKKPKLETLNLSLSLPDVSLSLTASNALQKPARSVQSLAPSRDNNTQTTCSNDFTAASLSYSYSHPFSHNPSCSLTYNSTENYEYSVGKDDQIWCGGEGTNGSVHSRFKPIGDGFVALNNHGAGGGGGGGGGFPMMQGSRLMNKDSCNNSLYKTTSSDNISFFPSELPARPRMDTNSGDSRRRDSENMRGLESIDGGRGRKVSRPERILREIVSESVPVVAQIIQELSEETLESIKEYLKNLFVMPEKREDLVGLQKRLERRSDLNKETLLKCSMDQLNILVAVKMGLGSFLSAKIQLPVNELVEIFLFMRCRNVNCKSILPVDDCDCKICSTNKGFCSSCMCPVCLNFDYANNTCSWVGCDVCSHWCHAACGIQRNLIKPGPSLKGPSGTSEMQFHCIGCNHSSEMFGFVKDVFVCCAKDWGLDTLVKELDCVRKIFRGSDDFKGKELHIKASELVSKLENKVTSPSDACNSIIQFFNRPNNMSDYPASSASLNDLMAAQVSERKNLTPIPPATLPPKYTMYNMTSSSGRRDSLSNDLHQKDLMGDLKIEEEFQFGKSSKNDGFDSLESIVRIKEAEARMFQNKADDARREAEEYKRMIRAKSQKLEEEYAQKLAKLSLQETDERRRKKLDELKSLEDSHCDYFKMKLRMQAEIAGLLDRMEATKQLWV